MQTIRKRDSLFNLICMPYSKRILADDAPSSFLSGTIDKVHLYDTIYIYPYMY